MSTASFLARFNIYLDSRTDVIPENKNEFINQPRIEENEKDSSSIEVTKPNDTQID